MIAYSTKYLHLDVNITASTKKYCLLYHVCNKRGYKPSKLIQDASNAGDKTGRRHKIQKGTQATSKSRMMPMLMKSCPAN